MKAQGNAPDDDGEPGARSRLSGTVTLRLAAALAAVCAACGLFRGAVNASPGLRWWLFSNFGAGRICPEMLKQGVGLRLSPNAPTVGRYFPTSCQHHVNEPQQTITVQFAGTGYAWTPLAGRVGFSAEAVVEYRMDFNLTEDATYVWANTLRIVTGPDFKLGAVENSVANWAAASTPVGYLANLFGTQIMSSQVASGFTVVHMEEGNEFALGHLSPPQRPARPFAIAPGDRVVYANDTTEIRAEQVDFLGPFEVVESDQALFFRFRVQGPAVDMLLMQRGSADLWREGLQLGAALAPPAQPPMAAWVAQPAEDRRRIPLPVGQYTLVIDNSTRVGTTSPPWNPLSVVGANSATVSYTAELGESDDSF
ncbi:MAG: hypothetical protein JW940_31265 [Polyangiaceae bacterium]|nr:hypothetical protein [Polyangiaceae bacterium]